MWDTEHQSVFARTCVIPSGAPQSSTIKEDDLLVNKVCGLQKSDLSPNVSRSFLWDRTTVPFVFFFLNIKLIKEHFIKASTEGHSVTLHLMNTFY